MNFFPGNLKFLRKKLGQSQAEFGIALNVGQSFIGYLERGAAEPTRELLVKISDIIPISIDDLLKKDLSKSQEVEGQLPPKEKPNKKPEIKPNEIDSDASQLIKALNEMLQMKDKLLEEKDKRISTIEELLTIKNQEITKLVAEREEQKRDVSVSNENMAGRSVKQKAS